MPICRKCEGEFPYRIVIDGKERNLSSRKFCLNCSPFGSKNTKPDDPAKKSYRKKVDGKRVTYSEWSDKAKEEHRARLYWKAKNRKNHLIKLKGGCCQECGYSGSERALTFHHREPSKKSFALDKRTIQTKSKELILKELDKCDLVCIRCHMELHDNEQDSKYEEYKEKFSEFGKWE